MTAKRRKKHKRSRAEDQGFRFQVSGFRFQVSRFNAQPDFRKAIAAKAKTFLRELRELTRIDAGNGRDN
jgi:hypothetical protein